MANPKGSKNLELTPKQKLFVINYTNPISPTFGNAFRSYKKAYNCVKSADRATMSSVYTLLKKDKMKKAITIYQQKLF